MNTRVAALGLSAAALGGCALLLTPHGSAAPGHLAAAGSDVPFWAVVLVALVLPAGVVLIILGGRRRRDREADAGTAVDPNPDDSVGPRAHDDSVGAASRDVSSPADSAAARSEAPDNATPADTPSHRDAVGDG